MSNVVADPRAQLYTEFGSIHLPELPSYFSPRRTSAGFGKPETENIIVGVSYS